MIAKRTVLITNDDGMNAQGLAVLQEAAASAGYDALTVAPARDKSGSSAGLTLRKAMVFRKVSDKAYMLDGTPADCVAFALKYLMGDAPPAIVLSGVNAGGNMGRDTVFSGTVGAAYTALALGLRAVAFSQTCRNPGNIPWETACHWTRKVLAEISSRDWPEGMGFNVNIPDAEASAVKGMAYTAHADVLISDVKAELQDSPDGGITVTLRPHVRKGAAAYGHDAAAVAEGYVAISPLGLAGTAL